MSCLLIHWGKFLNLSYVGAQPHKHLIKNFLSLLDIFKAQRARRSRC